MYLHVAFLKNALSNGGARSAEVPESCTSVAVGCRILLNLRTRVDNRSSRRTSHLQQLAAKKLHARSLVGSDGRDAALAIGRRVTASRCSLFTYQKVAIIDLDLVGRPSTRSSYVTGFCWKKKNTKLYAKA